MLLNSLPSGGTITRSAWGKKPREDVARPVVCPDGHEGARIRLELLRPPVRTTPASRTAACARTSAWDPQRQRRVPARRRFTLREAADHPPAAVEAQLVARGAPGGEEPGTPEGLLVDRRKFLPYALDLAIAEVPVRLGWVAEVAPEGLALDHQTLDELPLTPLGGRVCPAPPAARAEAERRAAQLLGGCRRDGVLADRDQEARCLGDRVRETSPDPGALFEAEAAPAGRAAAGVVGACLREPPIRLTGTSFRSSS